MSGAMQRSALPAWISRQRCASASRSCRSCSTTSPWRWNCRSWRRRPGNTARLTFPATMPTLPRRWAAMASALRSRRILCPPSGVVSSRQRKVFRHSWNSSPARNLQSLATIASRDRRKAKRMSTAAAQAIESLKPLLGDKLVTSQSVREHHSRDLSRFPPVLPDAVAFPKTEEEVVAIVRACAEHRVPIVPVGAASSLDGHTIPLSGGISISTRDMNQIREIRPEDLVAVVEPGVTRKQLNVALRDTGLMFPVDPGADASIGGMASTRGSGTTAVRYGTMRENVMALRVVTPDGVAIRTGSRAKKSSTGYDLTHLYVGAEGTLGIITELTVRLHPIPETVSSAICAFPSVQSAVEAVIATVQYGIPVARVEFMDAVAIDAVNRY